MMTTPYDFEADPPTPKQRAVRGTVQALVGMVVALLAMTGLDVPPAQVIPITAGLVALVGVIQNGYDAARKARR